MALTKRRSSSSNIF